MSRIAIVSADNPRGDAVGLDVRHAEYLLRRQGHEAEVFTRVWGPREPRNRRGVPLRAFVRHHPSAVVLYHHTNGWDEMVALLERLSCRRVLRYHNVTPARFFEPYNPTLAGYALQGREQLIELAQMGFELYLSDSAFNQSDLLAAGAPQGRCAVVPPFHQVDRLVRTEPDPAVLADCAGSTNWLFVGRRVPNKGHRLLIDAFAAYATYYDPDSRLFVVGRPDRRVAGYDEELRELVRQRGLRGRVVFIGGVHEAALRAYYAGAAALVVTSEHEGFCVPVIEAMALGVPVVAWSTTAVTDTAADAALLWNEPDPFVLAGSVHRLVTDTSSRQFLAQRGRHRYHERFRTRRLEADFLSALRPVFRHAVAA